MRIVQVVSGLGWTGGMQEYVAGLSKGLSDLGHEVVILAGGAAPPEGPEPHPLARDLEIIYHPKRRVARRYVWPNGMRANLHEYARWADIVHTHQPFSTATWLAASTRARLAASFHLHPEHVAGRSAWRRRLQLRVLLTRVDLLAVVSSAELDLISAIRQPRHSAVVWPGLERIPAGAALGGAGRPLVLYVGRLSEAKGVTRLLHALAHLPEGLELAIVGDGPQSDELRSLARSLGLDQRNVLRGGLADDELDALYQRADVFVSLSSQEAFGIAVMKAIAHGARPVVSDIASHREIVTAFGFDGSCLVTHQQSPVQVAEAIERAADAPRIDPALVRRVPTWEDSSAAMAEAYERVVAAERRWFMFRDDAAHRRPDSSRASR